MMPSVQRRQLDALDLQRLRHVVHRLVEDAMGILVGAVAELGVDVGHHLDVDGVGHRVVEHPAGPEGAVGRCAGVDQGFGQLGALEVGRGGGQLDAGGGRVLERSVHGEVHAVDEGGNVLFAVLLGQLGDFRVDGFFAQHRDQCFLDKVRLYAPDVL